MSWDLNAYEIRLRRALKKYPKCPKPRHFRLMPGTKDINVKGKSKVLQSEKIELAVRPGIEGIGGRGGN